MSTAPLPPFMLFHLVAALAALAVLIALALIPRGTPRHRWAGRLWMGAMAATALSSFGVKSAGGLVAGFSWLHVLSVWTLLSLAQGWWAIRTGRVRAHRNAMLGLASGLVIAFAFTFLPGRVLGEAARSLFAAWSPVSIAIAAEAPPEPEAGVLVRVIHAPDPKALINVGLFADPDGPAKGAAPVFAAQLPPIQGAAAVRFITVPPGRWTLAAFQDLNGDGQLGRNFLGIPQEPAVLGGTLTLGADPVAATLDFSR